MSKKTCSHLDAIQIVQPSARGCEGCLKVGVEWVHLRVMIDLGESTTVQDGPIPRYY